MALDSRFDQVLAAARDGEQWAVAALYRDLHPSVLRFLRAQEPNDAEDLAADAWLDMAEGLHRFSGGEQDFRRWAFTIARRRLVDARRRAARRRTVTAPHEVLDAHLPAGDVEAEAMGNLGSAEAMARIAALPPDQAEVVLLRVIGGFGAAEAAAIVGKRPGAVRALSHRALLRLARELDRDSGEAVTR